MPDSGSEHVPSPGEVRRTGRVARIGFFGGTFDPPHRGHLAVARAARDCFQLDRILLAPTGRQPLKPSGPEASWNDRLRMTELLCAGEPRLEASALDAPRTDGEPNYTVDTLQQLRASLNRSSGLLGSANVQPESIQDEPAISGSIQGRPVAAAGLFAILGADAFLGLRHWRDAERLLRAVNWIVVSRPGFVLPAQIGPDLKAIQPTRVHLLSSLADPTSATALRSRLHAGEDCRGLIPEAVLAYIADRRLYSHPSC